MTLPGLSSTSTMTPSRKRRRATIERCSSISLLLGLIGLCWKSTQASNWAQTTGFPRQNNVIPRMPNPNIISVKSGDIKGKNDHWTQRAGMAVLSVPENLTSLPPRTAASIFVLGGDSYLRESTYMEHSGQYHNDVWYTEGVTWHTVWDRDTRNPYGALLQKTYADMTWGTTNQGMVPPVGVSYDDWIQCQANFENRDNALCADTTQPPGSYVTTNMWSPRSNLGVAHLHGVLYVLGGRSRSHADIGRDREVGGVVHFVQNDKFYSNAREASVLLNDVWKSTDWGISWNLVTAGCKSPQLDQILAAGGSSQKYGSATSQCRVDSDCFGNEICNTTMSTCVCQMWSPREAHTVTTDGAYMYVMGGFTSPQKSHCGPYACGDPWANAYTGFMNDIWRSMDGKHWQAVTLSAPWVGRGGHQVVIYNNQFLLVAGKSGQTASSSSNLYLKDLWRANTSTPHVWIKETPDPMFPGRADHSVVIEQATAQNNNNVRLFVIGGENETGALSDVWAWSMVPGASWLEDYTPQAIYTAGSKAGFVFEDNGPLQYYFDGHTPVEQLIKHFLPTSSEDDPGGITKSYLTDAQVEMLHSVGIYTIEDMTKADQTTILKLRGWDVPQVEMKDRLNFATVCDFRVLCQMLLTKCNVDVSLTWFDGERFQPRNLRPAYKKGWPTVQYAQWYGVDYTTMNPSLQQTVETDPDQVIMAWDGCSKLPDFMPANPNVPGLGEVSQVEFIRDPTKDVNELHCKTHPFPRKDLAAGYLQERVWLFGGRQEGDHLAQDSWYRDDRLPSAWFMSTPKTRSSTPKFRVRADEDGCYFEYRVYHSDSFSEVRGWTESSDQIDVAFLNSRKGGPGSGNYIMYVRAVDPAGNRDNTFVEGQNMYNWYYKNPSNLALILGGGGAGLAILITLFMAYRRRMKRRAMERYALKRMRRKFKGMQQDSEKGKKMDWRDMRKNKKDDDKKAKMLAAMKKKTGALGKKDGKADKEKEKKKKKRTKAETVGEKKKKKK